MHGHLDVNEFYQDISGFLVGYYLALAAMNALAAWFVWRRSSATVLCRCGRLCVTTVPLWLLTAGMFGLMSATAVGGDAAAIGRISLPQWSQKFLNVALQPTWYTLGTFAALGLLFLARRFFVRPAVAWAMLNLAFFFLGLSMTDPDFARIVGKPDNVPIVGMLFLLGFFTWLGAYRAVENDARIARGEPTIEQRDCEKVLVWPDLVYIELICMVAVMALLICWSLALPAPLEQPADPLNTPNPSKAPWYFLGLQEMLVYFDPWMSGVVLPVLIILGLAAIPYLDTNKLGNGYYTIGQRRFAYVAYQFGFLALWISLIVIGTFLRGPNWSYFGLYETWDVHKAANLENVTLSEYFWIRLLHTRRPLAPDEAGTMLRMVYVLFRELPGLLLLTLYFLGVPWLLVKLSKFFRRLYDQMGGVRYAVMILLLLVMVLLPIKMLARWTGNLSYIVSIPELRLNL
jgi:hypothetical protein